MSDQSCVNLVDPLILPGGRATKRGRGARHPAVQVRIFFLLLKALSSALTSRLKPGKLKSFMPLLCCSLLALPLPGRPCSASTQDRIGSSVECSCWNFISQCLLRKVSSGGERKREAGALRGTGEGAAVCQPWGRFQQMATMLAAAQSPQVGQESRSVFVGNIPYTATEEQLQEVFESAGPVLSFR